MTDFTQEVIRIIQQIPSGKVMTYGQIATLAGNPWGARQVVRILHSSSSAYDLPWHRVVNAHGGISLRGAGGWDQTRRLSEEDVIPVHGIIDLKVYLYRPENVSDR
jgi:methylated-DNA-protein-cysteine methyltransferase-like protein